MDHGAGRPWRARIDASFPFAEAARAHRRILSHGNTGKIVLVP